MSILETSQSKDVLLRDFSLFKSLSSVLLLSHGQTSVKGGNLLTDAILALLGVEGGTLKLLGSMLSGLALLDGNGDGGVSTNGIMGSLVHGGESVSINTGSNEATELELVTLTILSRQLTHVVGNVLTKNVLANHLGIGSLLISLVAGEALLSVGNVHTTIDGTLEGSKELATGGGATETNIKEGLEGTGTLFLIKLSSLETKLVDGTTSAQQTSAVGSSPVGQTNFDTKGGELMSIGSSQDLITGQLGINKLTNHISVGEANDKAVLGSVVLVLILDDETLTGIVVRLSLTATTVLDLVTLEVGLVLDQLDERLNEKRSDDAHGGWMHGREMGRGTYHEDRERGSGVTLVKGVPQNNTNNEH